MSAGGWPLTSIDPRRAVAGERSTWVPSLSVTPATRGPDVVVVEVNASATTPPSRMTTASPSTTRAAPRTDIGSKPGDGGDSSPASGAAGSDVVTMVRMLPATAAPSPAGTGPVIGDRPVLDRSEWPKYHG